VYFGPVQLGTIDGVTLKFEPCAHRPIRSRARNRGGASCPRGPTASGIALRIPAVDLWTTRQSMKRSAKKCYPCCRIIVLPMLPVDQARRLSKRRF
jgi:hypothetical protein